jgi:hypothetical protein
MQTLKRQIKQILRKHFPGVRPEDVEKAADELLSLRAFQHLPNSQQPGVDWLIAAGVGEKEIAATLEKEKKREEIARLYERAMGYNPLPWESSPKLKKLLDFLVTKPEHEIEKFARWSKWVFSGFNPAKARLYPNLVPDMWPLAMEWVEPQKPGLYGAVEQLKEWVKND